jgi:hypothetical protein
VFGASVSRAEMAMFFCAILPLPQRRFPGSAFSIFAPAWPQACRQRFSSPASAIAGGAAQPLNGGLV